MQIIIEISDKSIELLKRIKEHKGWVEFKDAQFDSLEEYKQTDAFKAGIDTEQRFFNRNFCEQKDLKELICAQFIEHNMDSWTLTYVLTDLGKKVLDNLEHGQLTINYN